MSDAEKNCWVQRDEQGNITIVGESSCGIPPQVPESDKFNKNDQVIKDFLNKFKRSN